MPIFLPRRSFANLMVSARLARTTIEIARKPRHVAGAGHGDRDGPAACERVEQRSADTAAENLNLVRRQRRRALRGRVEPIEPDVELLLGEIALIERNIERRIGEDAEFAHMDGWSGGGNALRGRDQHGAGDQQMSAHHGSFVQRHVGGPAACCIAQGLT